MSVNGVLYDIRDQRMATKLDYIHASLTQALEHKQDLATAVVTDNDSVNWIGRLTSGSTSSVTRYKDDYIETITGPADTHIHSLWFSMGPISYDPADKDNKELEQQRAWSKSFGVEFQELTKRPRILGLDDKDQRAEVNIYGKSLHTEYIDSPLGINYIHPDKVEAIEHNIIGLPHSIPELDCLQWLYYGKRDNETNTTPLLENINIIGNASAITNIALWDFFQKEDNKYYRVLSEERIANKQINKEQKPSNAYKIVTLDENGIIPDIFLGELKSNPLNIGNVHLIDDNSQFIIKNDNVTDDNFVIAIQPSDTDTDTTKLTQTTINTKNITANNITASDTTETKILQVNEDASITGKVSANNATIANLITDESVASTKAVGYDDTGKLIPINSIATKIEPTYTSEDLTEVTSGTIKYIHLADCSWEHTGTLQVHLTGNAFEDTLVINFGGGNGADPMLCGHYSGNSNNVLSVIAQKGSAGNSNYSIYLKVNQATTCTVNVALLKGSCTINITESTTAPTNISEWHTKYGLFGNLTGNVSSFTNDNLYPYGLKIGQPGGKTHYAKIQLSTINMDTTTIVIKGTVYTNVFEILPTSKCNARTEYGIQGVYYPVTSGNVDNFVYIKYTGYRDIFLQAPVKMTLVEISSTAPKGITFVDTTVLGYVSSTHTHDDRYYTESEVNTKLSGKSDIGHIHTKSQITDFPTSLPANGGNANIATTAAKLGRDGNTGVPMTFHWSGQGGQPSWLWGGNDGSNMYVYNPSNFSVNTATTAYKIRIGNSNPTDGDIWIQ